MSHKLSETCVCCAGLYRAMPQARMIVSPTKQTCRGRRTRTVGCTIASEEVGEELCLVSICATLKAVDDQFTENDPLSNANPRRDLFCNVYQYRMIHDGVLPRVLYNEARPTFEGRTLS